MSFAKRGYDDLPEEGSGGGRNGDIAEFARFYVPEGGCKRVLFLDTNQFAFYEHGLWALTGKSKDKCLCLGKNKLDERGCPLCDNKMYPAFTGYLTVVELGNVSWERDGQGKTVLKLSGYQGKTRLYQFEKKLFGAKKGKEDKPGMMMELKRLAERRGGDLTGTVWDTSRPGRLDEVCGTKMDFIERVPQADWKKYLVGHGADPAQLDREYPDGTHGLEPYNYDKMFIPPTYEALARKVGAPVPKGASAGTVSGAGYTDEAAGEAPGTDDIPF